MSLPPLKPSYTVAEAALVLGVCERTVRRWLARGWLLAVYRGGQRRVSAGSTWARRRWGVGGRGRAHASKGERTQ